MTFESFITWPFTFFFGGVMAVVGILLVIFWIWMIIDAAKRKYRNDLEKIIWILILIFAGWIGAVVYYFTIKKNNPKGLAKK